MRTAAVVVVLVLGAGCGGGGDDVPPSASEGTWAAVAASLEPGLDAGSSNPCTRGDPACVTIVVAEMDERLEALAAACDHAAAFAFMYRQVTATVRNADAGYFRSPASLRHLDAIFAALYFDARDAWEAGRSEDVPAAWRIAFRAGDARRVSGIGDMLLGMNAHITRDLPFALAAIESGGGQVDRADFDRVNELLGEVQAPMLATAAKRFDPTVDDFVLPALDVDELTVAALLAEWRAEAWANGERLAAASNASARSSIERDIEQRAALRALLIRSATGYVPFLTSTRTRDDHCRAARQR